MKMIKVLYGQCKDQYLYLNTSQIVSIKPAGDHTLVKDILGRDFWINKDTVEVMQEL